MARTVTHEDGGLRFGGKEFLALAARKSFSALVFELLSEREPSPAEETVFELLLNLSIDHGPDTPSAKAVIAAAEAGATLSEGVSVGIREINDVHGGAGEAAMKLFYRLASGKETAENIVAEYRKSREKIPGFGHRLYAKDPRAELLLETLAKKKFDSKFIIIAREIETALRIASGKNLPVNIDGAIAVSLCGFGWQPVLGKAVFILARTAGLAGQYLNASR